MATENECMLSRVIEDLAEELGCAPDNEIMLLRISELVAENERLRRDLAEQQRRSGRKPTIYAHDPQGFIDETSTRAALPRP